jgi:hypothetical protein
MYCRAWEIRDSRSSIRIGSMALRATLATHRSLFDID